MNLKRFVAIILTAIMIMSMLPVAFAGTFPDVTGKHSWATQYIEDMVKRGLLKGYTDGTFKPDSAISKMEAVILSARILGVTYEENAEFVAAANTAFADELASYDIQYKKEVAYLLYWGVLKLSELPTYIGNDVKNTAMKRYEVAVLLTKVMGGEQDAQSNSMVVLDFSDDSQIPAASKAYVQYISDSGIMNGMENNLFAPMIEVTRAMMATMMYRAEQYMDFESIDATVTSVSASSNKITATIDGSSQTIELPSDVIINVGGSLSSLSDIKSGYNVHILYQGEKIRLVEALSTRSQGEKTGVISALSNNGGARTIAITTSGTVGEKAEVLTLSDDCVIIVDKSETIFTSLKNNYFVKMDIKNGKVIKVTAETKEVTYNGTITDINMTETSPSVSVKLKDGSVSSFELTADAVIIRNSTVDEVRNLAVGDSVDLVIAAGRIKRLTATSVNKNIEGIIEEIVISANPSITLKSGGVSTKYTVAANTVFYVQDEQATIYDMKLGSTANVSLKSENIDKIKISQTIVPSQLIGNVTSVNPVYNVIGIDVLDATTGKITATTVVVKSNVKIIDNTTTKISTLKGITAGRSIIALGALDNYGTYSVSTIIITQ